VQNNVAVLSMAPARGWCSETQLPHPQPFPWLVVTQSRVSSLGSLESKTTRGHVTLWSAQLELFSAVSSLKGHNRKVPLLPLVTYI
jgi:hypothetical protein